MPRDSQRQRLYDAERAAFRDRFEAFEDRSYEVFTGVIIPRGRYLPREKQSPRLGPGSFSGRYAPSGDVVWYRWESKRLWRPESFRTVAECQAYVDTVCKRIRFPHYLTVTPGKGATWARARYGSRTINLPLWARTKPVILHEIAHHATHSKCYHPVAAHGPEFARVYLDLVRKILGQEDARLLRESFRQHRVRTLRQRRAGG